MPHVDIYQMAVFDRNEATLLKDVRVLKKVPGKNTSVLPELHHKSLGFLGQMVDPSLYIL